MYVYSLLLGFEGNNMHLQIYKSPISISISISIIIISILVADPPKSGSEDSCDWVADFVD